MTLEEAKALPRHACIWVRMTNGFAQQFKTYDRGITQSKRVEVITQSFGISERQILDGQVLVEVTENGGELDNSDWRRVRPQGKGVRL